MSAIHDFITRCRRKLVDTSMRNRLLNYKPGARSGSVEIVGEHPVAVWEIVFQAKRPMVFRGPADDEGNTDPRRDPGLQLGDRRVSGHAVRTGRRGGCLRGRHRYGDGCSAPRQLSGDPSPCIRTADEVPSPLGHRKAHPRRTGRRDSLSSTGLSAVLRSGEFRRGASRTSAARPSQAGARGQ